MSPTLERHAARMRLRNAMQRLEAIMRRHRYASIPDGREQRQAAVREFWQQVVADREAAGGQLGPAENWIRSDPEYVKGLFDAILPQS